MTTQTLSASSADTETILSQTESSTTLPEVDTSTPVEAVENSTQSQDAPEQADSSPTEGAKHDTLLSLVKSVVKESQAETPPVKGTADKPESQSPEGAEAAANPPPSGDADAKAKDKPEEDESLPFHKHPRWKAVIQERNEALEQVTAFKDKAAQFDAISDYMTESQLTPEEVNKGFIIMAAIRNDPAKAMEMLSETISYLRSATGEDLPEDITKLVEDAEISEGAARELARARAQVNLQEARQREFVENQQRNQAAQVQNQIIGAVENWETQVAARDPDYQAKRSLVLQNIRLANLETPARNAQEALAIAESAYAKASEIVKGFRPKPVELKAPKSEQSLSHAKAAPKSLADVVRGALV